MHLFYTYYQCDVPSLCSAQGPTPAIKKVRQQFLFLINQSARIHARIGKNCRSWEIDAPVRRDFYVDAELECASLAMKKMHIDVRALSNAYFITPCNPLQPFSVYVHNSNFHILANERVCRCSAVCAWPGSIEIFNF